ncbi:MAG: amino acid adenylation domain-containing protein [Pseudomonadota bacterium]
MMTQHAHFPLTLSQSDIYFDQLHQPDSPLYNVGGYIRLGRVDAARMAQAHRRLVEGHDAFGIRIVQQDGAPAQYICAQRCTDLPQHDFSACANPVAAAQAWLTDLFETPVAFENAELFRAYLLKLGAEQYWYVGFSHHLAMDGWGFANWARQLGEQYNDAAAAAADPLSWQAVSEGDQAYLAGARINSDRRHWAASLQDLPERMLTPSGDAASGKSRRHVMALARSRSDAVAALAEQLGAGRAQVFASVLAVYLHGACDRARFVLGMPVHNRHTHAQKQMIGVFTSISPLLVEIDPTHSFGALVKGLGQQLRRDLRHQRYPLGHLIRDLGLQGGGSRLYDVAFNYLKLDSKLAIDQAPASLVYLSHNHEATPLMVTVWEYGEGEPVELQLDYNLDYFNDADIAMMADRLGYLLDQLPSLGETGIGAIGVLPPAEQALLAAFNADRGVPVPSLCVHELFEAQAAATPDTIAVESGAVTLSYRALNEQANRIAHRLRAEGVGPDSFIGLCMERSADMVAGLLGILKAGGAYVPLDPAYPRVRLDFMLEDAEARIVLTQSSLRATLALPAQLTLCLDERAQFSDYPATNPERGALLPTHLSHLIYTSGSTGKPKGVMIEHRNTVAMLVWAGETFSAQELRSVLASTSLNFDLSVFEIFVPLSYGHRCVVVRDALALLEHSPDVSLVNTVPSAMKILLERGAVPASVQTINLAGEPLPRKLLNGLFEAGVCSKVWNLYGPSEDTTYSTGAKFEGPVEGIPGIGRAVSHTRLHVLSAAGTPLPLGAIGELYIGGAGLSRGYLKREQLTADKFVADPFIAGERLYRTGDMVRWLPDGSMAFLGRADDQVKIRGFRIELGEIETRLSANPEVKEAVVVARGDDGERQLVAYVVGRDADGEALAERLRAALRVSLADYMVPGIFVMLDAFPLSPNGKIDKRALPAPQSSVLQAYVAPATETERVLAEIWQDLLKREQVSADANFFNLGGHSLLATSMLAALMQRLSVKIPLRAAFEHAQLNELAAFVDAQAASVRQPIIPLKEALLPLSHTQERMRFIDQLDEASGQYNMPAALHLKGTLDVGALNAALDEIVRRHQVLRTTYSASHQHVQPARALALTPLEVDTETAQRIAAEEAVEPFDLAHDQMLRARLLRLAPQSHMLLITLHHIAADGWSLAVIVSEFETLYRAFLAQEASPLPELTIQYGDYAHWQRQPQQEAALAAQLEYWRARLHGLPQVHSLPLDRVRPARQDFQGQVHVQTLDGALLERLQTLATSRRATLFMVLQSAFTLLLGRWSNESDIVMGVPVAGRTSEEVKDLVGLFVNTLVLRTSLAGANSFDALLEQARSDLLDAYAHQDLPFEQLVDAVNPERSLAHAPLFQVLFVLHNTAPAVPALAGLDVSMAAPARILSKFDLELSAREADGAMVLEWTSARSLFDAATIERLSASFALLLDAVARAPGAALGELALLTDADNASLAAFNADRGVPVPSLCVHEMFEAQAAATPDAIAIESGTVKLSYRALNEQANRIAHRLRAEGVGPDSFVGLCMERSADMVAGLLGILKAGGAYVPLDPTYPRERLDFMLEDAEARIVLTQSSLRATLALPAQLTLCLDERAQFSDYPATNPERGALLPTHLSHLIYTSGSTGKPKGVMIEHRNTVAMLVWAGETFSAQELRSVLASTSLNFDLSVFEIFVPLSYGHRCVVVRDALALLEHSPDVSLVNTVPSAMKILLERGAVPASVQTINLAGEPLPRKLLNGLFEAGVCSKVWNLYGPSEDTTYSTGAMFEGPVEGIPGIGRAVSHTRLHVLSAAGTPLPLGAIGELYIGGAGLSRGYLKREQLTAEKFVADPFIAGERLYRTGDMVRWLPDGSMAFLGRADDQVKIRGFRIELGEIETRLSANPEVKEAVVVARGDDGERQLVAYVVGRDADGEALADRLRAALRVSLADYMVPGIFVMLDAFPLSPNGKIDKRALPAPQASVQQAYVAPATDTERVLAEIWQDLLKLGQVSATANFFHLGGNSLLLTQMIHLAFHKAALSIGVKEVFASPTIASLAAALDARTELGIMHLRHEAAASHSALSFAQQRIWFGEQMQPGSTDHNIVGAVKLARHIEPAILRQALLDVAARHDILRTCFSNDDGQPRQIIEAAAQCVLHSHALGAGQHLATILAKHASEVFVLDRLPLFSVALVATGPQECVLQMNIHHIIADGWSVALLFDEIERAVAALEGGTPLKAAPGFVYRDYVAWQQRFLQSGAAREQQQFWRGYLDGAPGQLVLPFQAPAPVGNGARGQVVRKEVAPAVRARLNALAGRSGGSMFNVMHAALAVLLGRLCAEPDLTIGIPVAGRNVAGTESLAGMFLNNLPLRSRIDLALPFQDFLAQQVANANMVLSNQDLPFETILDLSGADRNPDSTPLFQVFLNMLSLPKGQGGRDVLREAGRDAAALGSKFNLSLYVSDAEDGISLYSSFNEKLLDRADIDMLLDQLVLLLEQTAADPSMQCGRYCLRVGAAALPDPALPLAAASWIGSVQTNVTRMARQWPQRLALECTDRSWTYGQLDQITDLYAARLSAQGVVRGDVVGIMTDRSDALVIATLSVLKTGAAFMMLSHSAPALRVIGQMETLSPRCLVTLDGDGALDPMLAQHVAASGCARMEVHADPALASDVARFETVDSAADDCAYIAFTSGTEGRPKAIRGRHSSLTTFMPWMAQRFGLCPEDRFGMLSGLVHDPLHRDMFTPLCMGAALCVPREQDMEFGRLNSWLLERGLTVLHLTPSLGAFLSSVCDTPVTSLRIAFFVGEIITTAHLRQFAVAAPNMQVINIYGSTETGRAVSYHDVAAYPDAARYCTDVIPVGQGIDKVQLLVLNDLLTPCGVGELGQIATRSHYMSLGYHEDADLNARKFIPNPAGGVAADMVYLTGDRGRYRADGVVECHGRTDLQIKIRGFRVELSEIGVCLGLHPQVRQAAMGTFRDSQGELAIAAFVVASPGAATPEGAADMCAFLAQRLPDYMIPADVVFLDDLPRNENGKLDQKRLPPAGQGFARPQAVAAEGETETALLAIWQDVFGVEAIGVTDDFFRIGGHSLMATQLFVRIERAFGQRMDYKAFFGGSSIRATARRIDEARAAAPVPPAPARGRRQLTL